MKINFVVHENYLWAKHGFERNIVLETNDVYFRVPI